jgi:hypothetical protein
MVLYIRIAMKAEHNLKTPKRAKPAPNWVVLTPNLQHFFGKRQYSRRTFFVRVKFGRHGTPF